MFYIARNNIILKFSIKLLTINSEHYQVKIRIANLNTKNKLIILKGTILQNRNIKI